MLSGPVLRDTARLSQRYPPIARYGVFGVSTWPIGCDTPPPSLSVSSLERMRSGGAIPTPTTGVSQRYLRDTLRNKAKCVRHPPLRYYLERILCILGVSRIGPLSCNGPPICIAVPSVLEPWGKESTFSTHPPICTCKAHFAQWIRESICYHFLICYQCAYWYVTWRLLYLRLAVLECCSSRQDRQSAIAACWKKHNFHNFVRNLPQMFKAVLAGGKVFPPNITRLLQSCKLNFKANFTPKLQNALLQAWQPWGTLSLRL